MELAVRRTESSGAGLRRPLAWSLAIHAAIVLLVIPPDPQLERAQSPGRVSAQLLNAHRQPAVRPRAESPASTKPRFEAPAARPSPAILGLSAPAVAHASSQAAKPAVPESVAQAEVSDGSLAATATSASLPTARPLPSTGSSPDGASEAPRPDQVLAENQYRLAIGLEAKRFRRYPIQAREMGWEGTAEVWVTVGPSLATPSVTLGKSSGHGVLDREAITLLNLVIERVQVPPQLVARQGRVRVRIPIEYRIEN